MRTQIDIISGFLESGKTSFIQAMLGNGVFSKEDRVVILLCEEGMEELAVSEYDERILHVETISKREQLTPELFERLRQRYHPSRFLIEYNGTWKMERLLGLKLPRSYAVRRILHIVDGSTYSVYMNNMSSMMAEQIANCDAVWINRSEGFDSKTKRAVRQSLKNCNRKAEILFSSDCRTENPAGSAARSLFLQNRSGGSSRIVLWVSLLCIAYLLFNVLRLPLFGGFPGFLEAVNTVFLGILAQAVPFLLIGVFISSFLQVFVSDQKLVSLFTRVKWLGYPLAVVLGIFFPVCDCAMAPIAARLAKKGVPLPQVVTFLLAAPVVNPVVIVSTLYAFPGQPQVALMRVGMGILIALAAGILISFFHGMDSTVVTNTMIGPACASGYIGDLSGKGAEARIEAAVLHAGMEFFNIGRFVVLGAFLSAVLQTVIPRSIFQSIGGGGVIALLILLAAACFMSVCANSNAFIARSFLNVFPLGAVMAFMVMGPMLDFKNLLVLSGSFQKRFLLILVGGLFVLGFLAFWILSLFL